MSEIYGGHLVAKYLKEVEGVSTVFSLSGGHINRIYDGFLDYQVRLIDVRHEQAAAMMGHAYSIFTDQPGARYAKGGRPALFGTGSNAGKSGRRHDRGGRKTVDYRRERNRFGCLCPGI